MGVLLELPETLAERLSAEAAQHSLPLAEYIVRLLTNGQEPAPAVRTGRELVAYWQQHNLIGSRVDIQDAPSHARALRQQAERRQRD
jgi:hypothetical protein